MDQNEQPGSVGLELLTTVLLPEDVAEARGRVPEECSSTWEGYSCTRAEGHPGIHLAGVPGAVVAMWEDR